MDGVRHAGAGIVPELSKGGEGSAGAQRQPVCKQEEETPWVLQLCASHHGAAGNALGAQRGCQARDCGELSVSDRVCQSTMLLLCPCLRQGQQVVTVSTCLSVDCAHTNACCAVLRIADSAPVCDGVFDLSIWALLRGVWRNLLFWEPLATTCQQVALE